MMEQYNAIIIGSGQGGTPLAKKLAKKGWNTAMIEKKHVGGTCVNVGCTPTKAMIASAKLAYSIGKSSELGILTGKPHIDIAAILNRKNSIVESFRNGAVEGLEKTDNLDLIYGTASFTGYKKLHIKLNDGSEKELMADCIFIDTGTRPSIPGIEGLEEAGYFTSTTLMECKEVPDHLLIIGGGYVGLEFGQMYGRFGSHITILEHGKRFLSREDEDISGVVKDFLQKENIEIQTDAQVISINGKSPAIAAKVNIAGKEKIIYCSHILLSAGRTPNTDKLNLSAAGVETNEKGFIKVNEKLETSAKDVYAIGDVKGGPQFTHISYNDHLILYHNLIEGKAETTAHRLVSYTMFTDPQLGRVGITEQEARKQGKIIKVASMPMSKVARAIETGDTRGLMKAVVDADSGIILGAAIVGQEGGETMSLLQMAMTGGITAPQLREMIFAHPLYAESLNNLFMQLEVHND